MATEPTIDWKTLNCCAWEITPADIIQAAMEVHGSKCGAAPAVRYFNAVAMSIFATRELSVLADATWPQHTSYQDEDGLELCPDWRPIVLAMKPLDGTLAHNAEKWGVAGLHIDAGRIDAEDHPGVHKSMSNRLHDGYRRPWRDGGPPQYKPTPTGRWPANLLLDEDAAILLDQQSGCSKSTAQPRHNAAFKSVAKGQEYPRTSFGYEDAGGASRFFYCGKATKKDRGPGNDHPTVKPLALMKYLLTLLATPDGGVILDPFAGSGTTALAAKQLGRRCICVELDEHYCEIAASRLES
jgi:site-specific DNA-methyltransferase (adenine-specific)